MKEFLKSIDWTPAKVFLTLVGYVLVFIFLLFVVAFIAFLVV